MAVKLDLKTNRSLLDSKFESYRLTLEPIPVVRQSLKSAVQKVRLSDEQYGYLHVELSGILNGLTQDPWVPETVFYISDSHHVLWLSLAQDGRIPEPKVVWQIPDSGSCQSICTLSFPHPEWCLITNGTGTTYLLNSPSRSQGEPWQLCFTHSLDWCQSGTVVLNSTHRSNPSNIHIECLLTFVAKPHDIQGIIKTADSSANFLCVLEWLTFNCVSNSTEANSWHLKRQRRLVGGSIPKYSAFDTLGNALCVASEKEFSFVFDSCKTEVLEDIESADEPKDLPLYTYMQTAEEVTALFKLPNGISKSHIQVILKPTVLEILIHKTSILKGLLCLTIKPDESTWIIEDNKLEIVLTKAETGTVWQELIKGDNRGEEVIDLSTKEEILERLVHLTPDSFDPDGKKSSYDPNELEDCDLTCEFFHFTRLDGDTHKATHHVNLSGQQWLFNIHSSPDNLPAFCMRHDVDGLVWQPKNVTSEGDNDHFKIEHVATFPAFGFVQASKQDRKFQGGSLDFGFAVICDSMRHLYIYRQPETLRSVELRNRKTGKEISSIAKQHVISLEQCEGLVGMVTTKDCIFALSASYLYVIKMNSV